MLRDPQHPYTRTLLAAATAMADVRDTEMSEIVMTAQDVSLTYVSGGMFNRREVEAVKNVSLELRRGRTTAVVGESGSGKSSIARCLLRLEDVTKGTIIFESRDITHLVGHDMQMLRKRIQVVLQDPFGALNPRRTIGSAIAEGPIIHGMPKAEAHAKAEELLELVGLTPQAYDRHPHEFSGGQRQRICIARALALDPDVLIVDESVSALDVSIQAQILDLFRDLQDRLGFTMLFITHDLRVAAAIADDLLVMQNGRAIEYLPPNTSRCIQQLERMCGHIGGLKKTVEGSFSATENNLTIPRNVSVAKGGVRDDMRGNTKRRIIRLRKANLCAAGTVHASSL